MSHAKPNLDSLTVDVHQIQVEKHNPTIQNKTDNYYNLKSHCSFVFDKISKRNLVGVLSND